MSIFIIFTRIDTLMGGATKQSAPLPSGLSKHSQLIIHQRLRWALTVWPKDTSTWTGTTMEFYCSACEMYRSPVKHHNYSIVKAK